MSRKSIILTVALFVVIVIGMFFYAYLKSNELQDFEKETLEPVVKEEQILYPDISRVDAKHYYIDGTHTLVGEIDFPTPCDLLEAEATVMESFPEQVLINFNVINNADNCTQKITAQRFKVETKASVGATFSAKFLGRDIELNLVPAAEGELPEDFELFVKG